ncbi:MAG: hypothetical protein ACAH95_09990 [Fimbriimonas sp.]
MKLLSLFKSVFALTVAGAVLVLSGCGGDGDSATTGGTTGDAARQIIENAAFEGSLSSESSGTTTMTLQLEKSGGTQYGVAAFEQQPDGVPSRGLAAKLPFTGKVEIIELKPTSLTDGTIKLRVSEFSKSAPYAVLNFSGAYHWNGQTGAASTVTLNGTVTGTNNSGGSVSLNFTATEKTGPPIADFKGAWYGKLSFGADQRPYTVTFTQGNAPLKFVGAVKTDASEFTFNASQAQDTLAGEFEGTGFGAPGKTVLWYVTGRTATTYDGQYLIVDTQGAIVGSGAITGIKGTPPAAPALQPGLYTGTLVDANVSSELKLDITEATFEEGSNGAFILDPSVGDRTGGTVRQLAGTKQSFTVTTTGLQGPYSVVTFTGIVGTTTAGVSTQYNGTFTATRRAGGTASGSFSTFRQTSATSQISGTFTGNFSGNGNGSVVAAQEGNALALTVRHPINGGAAEYTVFGYVVGDIFVVEGDSLVSPSGSINAMLEGSTSNLDKNLFGSYRCSGTITGGNSFSDGGTYSVSKP